MKRTPTMFVLLTAAVSVLGACRSSADAGGTVIRFASGQWDPAQWTAVRQPNQDRSRTFTQFEHSIGVARESFEPGDYSAERDNAILVFDTGLDEAQVEVTLQAGPGFNRSSTPGIVVAPHVVDGVMEQGIGVFVAPYGFVAWSYAPGDTRRPVRVQFAGQLNAAFDLDRKHVLRCRFSKSRRAVALQVDDSDVLVLKFIGHPTLGTIDLELNSKVGLWGCHGDCRFFEFKVLECPTLSFDWPEKDDR